MVDKYGASEKIADSDNELADDDKRQGTESGALSESRLIVEICSCATSPKKKKKKRGGRVFLRTMRSCS